MDKRGVKRYKTSAYFSDFLLLLSINRPLNTSITSLTFFSGIAFTQNSDCINAMIYSQ